MKEKIEIFLNKLPYMTKQEAEFIKEIICWDHETQSAYLLAKQIFETELIEELEEKK